MSLCISAKGSASHVDETASSQKLSTASLGTCENEMEKMSIVTLLLTGQSQRRIGAACRIGMHIPQLVLQGRIVS